MALAVHLQPRQGRQQHRSWLSAQSQPRDRESGAGFLSRRADNCLHYEKPLSQWASALIMQQCGREMRDAVCFLTLRKVVRR